MIFAPADVCICDCFFGIRHVFIVQQLCTIIQDIFRENGSKLMVCTVPATDDVRNIAVWPQYLRQNVP